MKATSKHLISGGLAAAVVSCALAPGMAAYAQTTVAGTTARSAASSTKHYYSDEDVVALILCGTGPIADKHPDLARQIRNGRPPVTSVSQDAIEAFTQRLRAVDPSFHDSVTLAVQQNDPYKAEAALKRLSADISSVYKTSTADKRGAVLSPDGGWVWHDSYVLTEQNAVAVWQAAAVTTAAAVGEAVVVVAIVPAAASYQFEMNKAGVLEKQNMVALITKAARS